MGRGEAIRRGVAKHGLVHAMSAHNPLSALPAEEACLDAAWASGRTRAEGGMAGADAAIIPVDEIFRLQDVPGMKAREKRFLR